MCLGGVRPEPCLPGHAVRPVIDRLGWAPKQRGGEWRGDDPEQEWCSLASSSPTALASLPLAVLIYAIRADTVDDNFPFVGLALQGLGPISGALLATSYAVRSGTAREVWPLVPFLFSALALSGTVLVLLVNYNGASYLEGATKWFGAVFWLGDLLVLVVPLLAVMGGIACLHRIQPDEKR